MLNAWKLVQVGSSLSADGLQPELQPPIYQNASSVVAHGASHPSGYSDRSTPSASGFGVADVRGFMLKAALLGWNCLRDRVGRLNGQHLKMGVLFLRHRGARRLHADARLRRVGDHLRINLRIVQAACGWYLGLDEHFRRCNTCGVPARWKLAEIAGGRSHHQ